MKYVSDTKKMKAMQKTQHRTNVHQMDIVMINI